MSRLTLAILLTLPLLAKDRHPITGREIAQVMGYGGADWLVRSERELEEEPDKALDSLDIVKGSTVADIGAGVGYFTERLARRVGPQGRVFATDIQPRMLSTLKENLSKRGIKNVETILARIDDPKLPPASCDLILLVDVYHEFSEPEAMLRGMRAALKPTGRLVLLEYRAEDPSIPIRPEHKMTVRQVLDELQPEGFTLDKKLDVLPRQHILIFKKSN